MELLKNYHQDRIIKKSGSNTIKLVTSNKTHEQYVLKIIETEYREVSPECKEIMRREAQIQQAMDFPNVIKFVTCYEDNSNFYIIMEYANEGDLSQLIRAQERTGNLFSEEEVMFYFIQIAHAIKYIHDNKIVHRDLKPENIYLTKNNVVKLGDFGEARILEMTLSKTLFIGTISYMSPEVIEWKGSSFMSDIWALGCILYELCTLKPAFPCRQFDMKCAKEIITEGKYKPIPNTYSKELKKLISKMISKNPKKRPTINEILQSKYVNYMKNKILVKMPVHYNDPIKLKIVLTGAISMNTKQKIIDGLSNNKLNNELNIGIHKKIININNKTFITSIWNCPLFDLNDWNIFNFYHNTDVFIIFFSITDTETFDNAQTYFKQIDELVYFNGIICLCGINCNVSLNERKVKLKKALVMAYENKALYFELDTRNSKKIEEMFIYIAEYYLDKLNHSHPILLGAPQKFKVKK